MSVPTKGSVTQPQTCSDCHLTLGIHGIPPKIILCSKHAAAGDLLAALLRLRAYYSAPSEEYRQQFPDWKSVDANMRAEEAIARATGGQP